MAGSALDCFSQVGFGSRLLPARLITSSWTPTYRPTNLMPAMQPEYVSVEMVRRIASALHDHDAFAALDAIRDEWVFSPLVAQVS
jgi:hypothetical protein